MRTAAPAQPVSANMLHRLVGVTLVCAAFMAVLLEDTDPKAAHAKSREFAELIAEARTKTIKAAPAETDFIFTDEEEDDGKSALAPDESGADESADEPANTTTTPQTQVTAGSGETLTGPPLPSERGLPGMPIPIN